MSDLSDNGSDTSSRSSGRYSKKAKRLTKYNPSWENSFSWLREVKDNSFKASCRLCNKDFSCAHGGVADLKQHASTKSHMTVVSNRASSSLSQYFSKPNTSASETEDKVAAGELASVYHTPDAIPCSINLTALLMVLGVGAMQSVVNILMSTVVNITGRRNMAMVVTATCGVAGILINLVPNAIGSAFLFAVFLLAITMLGVYSAMSVALFPTHLRAMAVSLTVSLGRVGTFASVQILNYLLRNNCEVGFYVYASILASSAVVASFLPDDRLLLRPPPPKKEEEQL